MPGRVKVDGRIKKISDKLKNLLRMPARDVRAVTLKYRALCGLAAHNTIEGLLGRECWVSLQEVLKTSEAREILNA